MLGPMASFCNLLHGFKQLPFLGVVIGFRTCGIQPAAVLQFHICVVTEEIRGTDGAVGTRDLLGLVQQVGKRLR